MWQLLVPIGLALGVGVYFLGKPISDNSWQNITYQEYRWHLTTEETEAAQRGETVEKTHKVYGDRWHSYSDAGPLRVQWQNGRYQFTPHGTWHRLSRHGQLQAENIYSTPVNGVPYKSIWKNYRPDGSLEFVMYGVPEVLNGDSVTHSFIIQFGHQIPADTLYVNHGYVRPDGHTVRQFFSQDARGSLPMPAGWKPF